MENIYNTQINNMDASNSINKQTRGGYHYNGIDALRAFCCIAIVLWHVYANSGVNIGGFFVTDILPSWNYLVYLFMMISGFGMCCGYYEKFKNKQVDIEKFYLKRYLKILPFFAVLIILDVAIQHNLTSLAEAFMELTLVFGFLPNSGMSVIGVSWTIGVIFVFYLTFPFFVFLLYKKGRAWFAFIISIVIQVLCVIYFFTDAFGITGITARTTFISCTPFFLAGGIIYLYRDKICSFIGKHQIIGFIVCVGISVVYYFVPHDLYEYSLRDMELLIVYSFWLIYAVAATNKVFCNRGVKFVSGISMEIYLSHMVAFRVIEMTGIINALGGGWAAYMVISIVLLVILMICLPFVKKGIDFAVKLLGKYYQKIQSKKFDKKIAPDNKENS